MDRLLDKFVEDEVKSMELAEKLTGYLVRKKKRGTLQALEESKVMETKIVESIVSYIHGWLLGEFMDGTLKEKISSEIKSAVYLELARTGYDDILKNKK